MSLIHRTRLAGMLALGVASSAMTLAHADVGDYSAFQTRLNQSFPKTADRPITAADKKLIPLAINSNPAGFDDGFDPKAYDQWQEVKLDPSTGAKCGDGSPFSFWVNRRASTSNLMVFLEGGGACWDYDSCSSTLASGNTLGNVLKASSNKDTSAVIATSGLSNTDKSALIPIYSALLKDSSPDLDNKVMGWNKVFVPYCTGDVHAGLSTHVYTDPAGIKPPVTIYHNGIINSLQVAAWVRNNLQAPQQLMFTGQSAGGVGATALYHAVRLLFPVKQGFMLNDAGPSFFADQNGSDAANPSAPLHRTALPIWGLTEKRQLADGSFRSLLDWYKVELTGLDVSNFGTLNIATANRWPKDRLSMTTTQEDYVFGTYSYRRFFADTQGNDPEVRKANTLARWKIDIDRFTDKMQPVPNYGFYIPATRRWLYGHTMTSNVGRTADIQELGLDMNDYLNNLTDPTAPLMKAKEKNFTADRYQFSLTSEATVLLLTSIGF